MNFFDDKEEVLDVEITQFGKFLISQGLFNPVYYAFFDDDIIYDYSYAGITDEYQNDIVMTDKGGLRLNLKCDPVQAQMLRDVFEAVQPGYHMNKRHWNTVLLDGSLPDGEVQRMIDHSYTLVVRGLKGVERRALELAWGANVLYR